MERPPSNAILNTPPFFKILLDSNATHLGLPVEFVKNHMKGSIPEHSKLKHRSGKTWDVKIKERDGSYCFVDGWEKVMHDNNLQFGDFLVFWKIDPSTFHVLFFGPSGCEISYSPPDVCVKIEEDDDDDDDEDPPVDALEEPACFQKILTKSQRVQLGFPAKFVKEAGLVRGNATKMMVIEDPRGKKWRVKLLVTKKGRFILSSSGWRDIVQKNGLADGDICLFQLISRSHLALKLVKRRSVDKREVADNGVGPNPHKKVKRSTQSSLSRWTGIIDGVYVKRKRGRPPLKSKYF